jgi:predicted nucleic acid-binding protein
VDLPPSPIGFDTSVLINFCAVGRLGLLVRCVPPPRYLLVDVRDELEDLNSRRLVDGMIRRCELLLIAATESERTSRDSGVAPLDPGERATLAAAAARGWSVAVDERLARQVAASRVGSGRITGTVGILRAAVRGRLITPKTGDVLLTRMIRAGYYSPVVTLDGSTKRRRASSMTTAATWAPSQPRVSARLPGSSPAAHATRGRTAPAPCGIVPA